LAIARAILDGCEFHVFLSQKKARRSRMDRLPP
jgi:hypothetical protein